MRRNHSLRNKSHKKRQNLEKKKSLVSVGRKTSISTSLSPSFIHWWSTSCGRDSWPVVKVSALCRCVWGRLTEGRVCTHTFSAPFSVLSPLGDWWWEMSSVEEPRLIFKYQDKKHTPPHVCQSLTQRNPLWKQHLHDLKGTVRRVDEPELSDNAPWEAVDSGAAVASLHQADGLCWEKRKRTKDQLHRTILTVQHVSKTLAKHE